MCTLVTLLLLILMGNMNLMWHRKTATCQNILLAKNTIQNTRGMECFLDLSGIFIAYFDLNILVKSNAKIFLQCLGTSVSLKYSLYFNETVLAR